MLFNSYVFCLLFLPITICIYFLLYHLKKTSLQNVFLLVMSLFFYGYYDYKLLFVILGSILFNYVVYRFMERFRSESYRKFFLILGIVFNIGILFFYKYAVFTIENLNIIFGTNYFIEKIALPLGISFFTFQQISFVVDAYQDKVKDCSFVTYALFVCFFPQLIAGPIVTWDEMMPQFQSRNNKHINFENLASGIYIFALGMAKKVILADTFGNAVNWGYSNIDALDTTSAIVVMLSYTFQIYFDFSGYCDMASGIAKMLNFDMTINFNSPYKALTISEFWDRWHMTLTRFLTKYIYVPLGGNRKGKIRTYVNILSVFLVSGLWHGADWSFIMWGGLHGIFMVVSRWKQDTFKKMHPALSWMITFGFVNFTWILFRADNIESALAMIKRILSCEIVGVNSNIVECFNLYEWNWFFKSVLHYDVLAVNSYSFMLVFLVAATIIILGIKNAQELFRSFKPDVLTCIITVLLLFWSIISFSGISTFLYFNF